MCSEEITGQVENKKLSLVHDARQVVATCFNLTS